MGENNGYDSELETLKHIMQVQNFMGDVISGLQRRSSMHDASKLSEHEKPYFDEYTPKLKSCTYGSEEYKNYLKELKPALDHHYEWNLHHPEHYKNGIDDMDLISVIELFVDWLAATKRHADGDIYKSIEINTDRFNLSPQLASIFKNTAKYMELV